MLERVKKRLPRRTECLRSTCFSPMWNACTSAVLGRWQLEMDESFKDGSRIQRDLVREIDLLRQITNIQWRNKYQNQVLVHEWLTDLKLSYFFPHELQHLLAHAGFEIVHHWGDYARGEFWSMSQPWKQLVVARPISHL